MSHRRNPPDAVSHVLNDTAAVAAEKKQAIDSPFHGAVLRGVEESCDAAGDHPLFAIGHLFLAEIPVTYNSGTAGHFGGRFSQFTLGLRAGF